MELTVHVFQEQVTENMYALLYLKDIDGQKRRQQEQERAANTDPLTNVLNRRIFEQYTSHYVFEEAKKGEVCALLILDIDNFKAYNDTYGHEFGDLVLKFFADTLRNNLRSQDIVARLAGDEFTVLLSHLGNSENDVSRICLGLISALTTIEKIAGVPVALSASIGVSIGRARQPMMPDTLMARADAAMYRAKQGGKGRYYLG